MFVGFANYNSCGQDSLWINGSDMINFEDSYSPIITGLPQPNDEAANLTYNGEIAERNQIIQFDDQGELLFFIVDANIYDRKGYLIASSDDFCPQCNQAYRQGQLAVTMVPAYCNYYYIIYPGYFGVLDISAQNNLFSGDPDKRGALVNMAYQEELACSDEPEQAAFEAYFQQALPSNYEPCALNGCYNNTGCHPESSDMVATLSTRDNGEPHNEHQMIEILDNGTGTAKYLLYAYARRIDVYVIESDGLFYLYSVIPNEVIEDPEGWQNCALEVSKYNEKYYLAVGINSDGTSQFSYDNLLLVEFDLEMNLLNTFALNTHVDNISGHIGNLEFAASGRYLFYVMDVTPYIGYIDLSDFSEHDLSQEITISDEENYTLGQIELQQFEGVSSILFPHAGGLAALKGSDNPSTSVFIPNALPLSNMAFSDFETGPFGIYYFTQEQNYGESQVNTLTAEECCVVDALLEGTNATVIDLNLDGTWTNETNPFGNIDSPIRIMEDLTFASGTVTNINGMTFQFDSDADVIIQPGARVNLNGTIWTSLDCTAIMWPGVNLLGTTNATSSIDQLPMTGGDQGYLYMNNSTIEHAMRAVEVGTSSLNSGGIIRSYNSTFRNNQYDVIFKKYHYINSGAYYIQNKSRFSNCTFITDAHLNNSILSPVYHAWLNDVDKINFTNCAFMNKTDINTYNWFQRGRGIYSIRASFTVDGLNDPWTGSPVDPDQTTFYKLRYGISSHGYNNPLAYFTCKQQEFQHCLYGIVNYNTDNVMIYQNNFVLPDAAGFQTDESMERGIYLTNSTGYVVEQNFFDGFDNWQVNEDYPNALGIWVDNSGDADNQIRNNDFDEMKLGTYVTRNNKNMVLGPDGSTADDNINLDQTGLQLFCNTYTNGQTDIFRDSETLTRQDQGGNQGVNEFGIPVFDLAGNRFSAPDCNGAISDFVVDPYNSFYNTYWCHNQANTIPDCGGTSNFPGYTGLDLLTISISLDPFSDADCPNTYGGTGGPGTGPSPGIIGGLVGQLNVVRVELLAARNTYNLIVDDNVKQSTLDVLTEAFPHESQYYRDLLMQRYPLSDEVLRRIVLQSARFSPWHLTEVFLANSPLNKEVLFEIEKAEILSNFFMSFLYDADSGASLRRLMEQNMLGLATERDQLIQTIARAGLTYETDSDLETDQPIYVNEYLSQLALQNGSTALRIRAANLASKGDYMAALSLIEDEPLLTSYSSILQMEQSVGGDWSMLDPAQITSLWTIYNTPKDYSSSTALSILQQIGEADFEPEPRVPIQYRSFHIAKDEDKGELPLLGVWPNPATTSAWLHYPIEADEHATIQVFDPQGRLLNSFQPSTNGLVELSLKNYESGIYVVQLIAFDKVVESIKLTVINQH